jgi:hypothetical protein
MQVLITALLPPHRFAWEHPQRLLRGLAQAQFSWGPEEQKALEQYVISRDLHRSPSISVISIDLHRSQSISFELP